MSGDDVTSHFVLRIRERFIRIAGRPIDIIEEHNRISQLNGSVALAKFGACPHLSRIKRIREEVSSGQSPCIYVVCKDHGNFVGYRAPIADLAIARLTSKPPGKYPQYYDQLGLLPSVWFLLAYPLKPAQLTGLTLLSNQKALLDVLARSRSTMMFVQKGR
jgi:hypothetical protein